MGKWVFLNDDFVLVKDARLHISDLSFQRGYGVFDFLRLQEHEPLFLPDHLHRFYASAAAAHLPVPLSQNELSKAIAELMQKNYRRNTGIRVSLTGGCVEEGLTIGKPNLVLSQHVISPPTLQQRAEGIRLFTYMHQRQLPHIKSIDYFMAIWLQPWLKATGGDDILYHQNGFVTECPRSNFFLVTNDGRLVTPSENVLEGITRKKVIELARQTFTVEERPVHLNEIASAQEAFITSTTKRILPVAGIDGKIFTQQKVANRLLQQFIAVYGS